MSKKIILYFLFLFPKKEIFSQITLKNFDKFIISGKVQNKNGKIVLWYYDQYDKFHADTLSLNKGKFKIEGKVNKVCEATLWTNTDNINFGDPSVIKFLLEPGHTKINFADSRFEILGSKSQEEKEIWDSIKGNLIYAKMSYRKTSDSLYQKSKEDKNLIYQPIVNILYRKIDSINIIIRSMDVNYLSNNLNSYLSVYLLNIHHRKIGLDSLEMFYSNFKTDVKASTIGKKLLAIIYPLSTNTNFRKANPLLGKELELQLEKTKSLYDFSLKDINGKQFDFNSLKGKIIILDFWASWCGPCLANIPSQKQLIIDYKGAPLEFVSISLDTDLSKWKKAIKKYNLDGIQLSAPNAFNELIAIYYKVLYPPHYIIIDKNGMVINKEAPQPLDPELKNILDNLIK